MCRKALVCDRAWKAYSEMLFGMVGPQGSDEWGGGRVALYEDRHTQGMSCSNPVSTTADCALDEENEKITGTFRSNHRLVVPKAFVVEAHF